MLAKNALISRVSETKKNQKKSLVTLESRSGSLSPSNHSGHLYLLPNLNKNHNQQHIDRDASLTTLSAERGDQ